MGSINIDHVVITNIEAMSPGRVGLCLPRLLLECWCCQSLTSPYVGSLLSLEMGWWNVFKKNNRFDENLYLIDLMKSLHIDFMVEVDHTHTYADRWRHCWCQINLFRMSVCLSRGYWPSLHDSKNWEKWDSTTVISLLFAQGNLTS